MEQFSDFFLQHREAIFIVILSIFLGIEVISHVPAILHTPLMSGANAIHGVVIIGAIIVMGHADTTGSMILGFLAVVLGTLNVVGGFVVTDRMLEMFKKKNKTIRVKIGKPIPYQTFDSSKTQYEWAQWVKQEVYK